MKKKFAKFIYKLIRPFITFRLWESTFAMKYHIEMAIFGIKTGEIIISRREIIDKLYV